MELYIDFDSSLSLADISCTGDYQYAIEENELKIFGFSTLKDVYRGTVATLTFDVPNNAYGNYDVKVKECAFYNENFQTFSPATEVGLISADVTERPLYLTPSYVNSSSLRLSWSMPYCSGALEGYIVYRDGVEIARTSENWYYDENLENGKKYTYAVQAYGAENYLSAKSKAITSMPQNPSISAITFPDNASVIGGKSTYVKCSLEKTVDASEYSLSYIDLQGEKQTIFTGNNLAFSTLMRAIFISI
ncbi:MAG: fibronectin type III domain-containing protein [Ruminococcus sp.]|nr:fibronectin type III domain-containing protein [Ruminococcus sp.]